MNRIYLFCSNQNFRSHFKQIFSKLQNTILCRLSLWLSIDNLIMTVNRQHLIRYSIRIYSTTQIILMVPLEQWCYWVWHIFVLKANKSFKFLQYTMNYKKIYPNLNRNDSFGQQQVEPFHRFWQIIIIIFIIINNSIAKASIFIQNQKKKAIKTNKFDIILWGATQIFLIKSFFKHNQIPRQ